MSFVRIKNRNNDSALKTDSLREQSVSQKERDIRIGDFAIRMGAKRQRQSFV
jgi:hypothetical protein